MQDKKIKTDENSIDNLVTLLINFICKIQARLCPWLSRFDRINTFKYCARVLSATRISFRLIERIQELD